MCSWHLMFTPRALFDHHDNLVRQANVSLRKVEYPARLGTHRCLHCHHPEGAPPLSLPQATCTSGYSTPSSSTAYPWRPSAAPSRLATLASSPEGTSMAEWSCSSTSRTGTLKKSPLTRSVGARLPQPGPLSGSPSWLPRRQGL